MPQVSSPWAEAVYGAVQHDLLMAVLLENLYEPGRQCPAAKPLVPVGQPLPAPGQLAGPLGVDHTLAPRWQVTIHVPVIEVEVEGVPGLGSAPGYGPPLAQVGSFPLCLGVQSCVTFCSAICTGLILVSCAGEHCITQIKFAKKLHGNVERAQSPMSRMLLERRCICVAFKWWWPATSVGL